MANTKRPKLVLDFSPIGTAVWPKLNSPDYKFNEKGVFSTKLRCILGEAQALIDKIDSTAKLSLAEMKKEHAETIDKRTKKPIECFLCEDLPYIIDEATGTVEFSFKLVASGEFEGKKFTRTLPLKNAQDLLIDAASVTVGGGSTIRVAFQVKMWNTPKLGAGVQLRMHAVQVLKAVTYSKDVAFGAVPGYEAPALAVPADTDDEGSDVSSDAEGKDSSDF